MSNYLPMHHLKVSSIGRIRWRLESKKLAIFPVIEKHGQHHFFGEKNHPAIHVLHDTT